MHIQKNERGFGALAILLVVILIGVIGFAGWYIYQNEQGDTTENTAANEAADRTEEGRTIPDGWTDYNNNELGFAFAYPEDWGEITIDETTGESGESYIASFTDNATVSFSGATLDYRAARGGGVFTGHNKGWEEEGSTYYFVENYSDEDYRSETGDVSELEANNATGLYQEDLDPSTMLEAAEAHTVSFNVPDGSYHGLAFAYKAPEAQAGQDFSSQIEEFKSVVQTVEIL